MYNHGTKDFSERKRENYKTFMYLEETLFFFFTDENLVEQKSALNFSKVNFNLSPLKS